jgi:hypothetical protein
MTTVQDSTNGHHALPPPCSAENPADLNSAGLPTHKDNNNQFPASAYHVPPKLYAPKADSFRDTIPDGLTTMKMPDRCQFMFSDGRQCTMARSDIHPSLCVYHSEREEQLFGTPHTRGLVRGPSFDLPELFSASRDLTTAAGVNGALGQVFRLLAQRRISRQEAATFAKLAHLLLQSIRAAQAEADVARAEFNAIQDQPSGVYESSGVIPSSGESLAANVYLQDELRGANKDHQELSPVNSSGERHGHQELSPVNNVQRERRISPNPIPANEIPSPFSRHQNNGASVSRLSMSPSAPPLPPAASPESLPPSTAANNSSEPNASAHSSCNSPEINTYKNDELKTLQNQHLHEVRREHHGHQELRGVNKVGSDFCSSGRPPKAAF